MSQLLQVHQVRFRRSANECLASPDNLETHGRGACDPVPGWHQEFLVHVLPAVQSAARIRFRALPGPEREEALAEAVAGAMFSFLRLLQRGKNPTAFAGRLAHVAVLRVLAGRLSSSPDRSRDVLSRFARQRRGFTVESLDTARTSSQNDWETILVEDRKCTPADIAVSRLDFAEWLGRMHPRRRQIAEALGAGYRTEEVAEIFHLTCGRISQLRREFETSWRKFQQESPQTVAKRHPTAA